MTKQIFDFLSRLDADSRDAYFSGEKFIYELTISDKEVPEVYTILAVDLDHATEIGRKLATITPHLKFISATRVR